MFTGIVEAVGTIARLEKHGGDLRLYVRSGSLSLTDVQLGDSIATNGVCLTVVALPGDGYWADVSQETMAHTTLTEWQVGRRVNLEKALLPTTRLGGHLVSGHVDGVGTVLSVGRAGRSLRYEIEAPAELSRYLVTKGSITVDGVSLTVNAATGAVLTLNVVPHTGAQTIVADYQVGDRVNLEVDLIARYLEGLMRAPVTPERPAISSEFLAQHGFLPGSGRR